MREKEVTKMEDKYKNIKTEDPEIGEKHVPVVEVSEKGDELTVNIAIGDIEHPSQPDHFIQWIEILDGEISLGRTYLSPFTKPKATFRLKEKPNNLKVREFCNKHGTWEYSQ